MEISLLPVRGVVREGDGSARVNVSILRGSLGGTSISLIVSTNSGTASG